MAGISKNFHRHKSNEVVLSKREKEIILLLQKGNRTKKIAADLKISPRTVDNTILKLRERLNISSREDLRQFFLNEEIIINKKTNKLIKYFLRKFFNKYIFIISALFLSVLAFFIVVSMNGNSLDIEEKRIEWNIPKLLTIFVDRKVILNRIRRELKEDQNFKIVTLTGLSGSGKTSLAKRIANDPTYNYKFVCWLSSESKALLETEYLELGERYKLFDKQLSAPVKIKIVRDWIANQPNALIIFDNVDKLEDIESFLPRRGHIILTSIRSNLPGTEINIGSMSEEESSEFLEKILPDHLINHNSDLKLIGKLLGYLPIALSQAGSYMRQVGLKTSNFLKILEKKQKNFLKDHAAEARSHIPVHVSWSFNMERIRSIPEGSSAEHLLKVISQFYPERIPRRLLKIIFADEAKRNKNFYVNNLLHILNQFSMVSISAEYVSIHRLLHDFTDQMISEKEKKEILHKQIKSICSFYEEEYLKTDGVKVLRSLVPHMEYLAERSKIYLDDLSRMDLYSFISDFYEFIGDYERRSLYCENALKLCEEKFGNNFEKIIHSKYQLSRSHIRDGRNKEAIELLHSCLHYIEKNPLSSAPKTDMLYHLGWAYLRTSDYENATKYTELGVEESIKKHGKQSLKTADAMNDLGWVYLHTGEYQKAKDVLDISLETHRRKFGPDHIETIKVVKSLSLVLLRLKKMQQARELLEKAYSVRSSHYGKEHIKTANILNELGVLELEYGNFSKGLDILSENLERIEKLYDRNHNFSVVAKVNLAVALRLCGKINKAKQYLLDCLPSIKKIYGEQSVFYAAVLANLALVLFDQDKSYENNYVNTANEIFKSQLKEGHEYLSALSDLRQVFLGIKKDLPKGFYLIL